MLDVGGKDIECTGCKMEQHSSEAIQHLETGTLNSNILLANLSGGSSAQESRCTLLRLQTCLTGLLPVPLWGTFADAVLAFAAPLLLVQGALAWFLAKIFVGLTKFDVTPEGLLVNVGTLVGMNELVLFAVDSLVVAGMLMGNPVVPLDDEHTVLCFRRGCVPSRPLHPNASGATLVFLTLVLVRRAALITSEPAALSLHVTFP